MIGILTRALLVVFLVEMLASCASTPTSLDRMQRDIQNCILSGGHPRLGPDNTVVCVPR